MILHTKTQYKNLKGELIEFGSSNEPLTLGDVLSEIILQPHQDKKGFRPLDAWELAKKFYKQEEVEVNLSDFVQLKELVEESKSFYVMIIAQTLEMLETSRLNEGVKKK